MNSDTFITLVYSEPWHVLKLWYIQNPVKYIAYSEQFVPIAYLDSWYIQNLSIFRTEDIENAVIF